jgi:hypothetical protein
LPNADVEIGNEVASVGVTVGVIATVGVPVGMGVPVDVISAACAVIVWATSVYTLEMLTWVGVGVPPPPQALNAKSMAIMPANKIVFVFISLLIKFSINVFTDPSVTYIV